MKAKNLIMITLALLFSLTAAQPLRAHVPYFEREDFTAEQPFEVRRGVEQSIAVYAWLETGADVDVVHFQISEPVRVFVQSLVPVCAGYEDFLPWFAVVGPGLPQPVGDIPFAFADGDGAIVVANSAPGDPRESFYEPFGGKSYYEGPAFDQQLSTPGDYWIVFWDPLEIGGDYAAIIGFKEQWGVPDILRALVLTPMIRQDKELHQTCVDPAGAGE